MMMNINTNTEANQNFSRVARMVDENDSAVVLKKQCASLFNNGVLYCWTRRACQQWGCNGIITTFNCEKYGNLQGISKIIVLSRAQVSNLKVHPCKFLYSKL